MKIILSGISILLIYLLQLNNCSGQVTNNEPTSSLEGKKGAALKTALFESIKDHKVIDYYDIWTTIKETDLKPDGSIWDMYSDNPSGKNPYTFYPNETRCGSFENEGDCYNREHSVPKSWFKKEEPMLTDLFHIYPTDGLVNNRRSNYPYGEVGIYRWISENGSKVGQNTFGDYTRTVFEPIDEYKGDLARTYFYMVTAYENNVATWNSPQIGGSKYPAFSDWSLQMFLKWHRQDPVSEKEQNRNNAIYRIQGNRNPYIDFPELAEHVWGNKKNEPYKQKR